MARFLRPPDLNTGVTFVHADLGVPTKLALGEPLTGAGGTQLVVVSNNPGVATVSPPNEQSLSPHGFVYFNVYGKAIGYSFLDARLGANGGSWGKTQVIVGEGVSAPAPDKVGQQTNWTCWAAAMQSFLAAGTRGPKWSKEYLAGRYGIRDRGELPSLPEEGYEPHRCLKQLYPDIGVHHYDGLEGTDFTFRYIHEKLKEHKYLLLTYNAGFTADGKKYSHVVVVYACRKEPEPYGETVTVMDPGTKKGNYDKWPISHFRQYREMLVAWQS
jgi:hypothetical protein